MSSPNGKVDIENSPSSRRRDHSSDTARTKRSPSRERHEKRRERERGGEPGPERRRSRDRGGRDRDRSRDRSHRDRERGVDRDRERERERDRDRDDRRRESREDRNHRGDSRHSTHRERDRDRGERDREDGHRRRKRSDDGEDVDSLEDSSRSKRKKAEDDKDAIPPSPRSARSDRRDRSRDSDRRRYRDSRDDYDESRYRRGSSRDRDRDRDARRGDRRPRYRDDDMRVDRRSEMRSPAPRRKSPSYEPRPQEDFDINAEPKEDDSEARSIFVSQLAARLTARDLGYFFEDKLGEGTVMDSRIVTDRLSRRSKGIGYVEFRSIDLVDKALALTGTIVMGLPIMVQLTEAERNRLHPGDGNLNLPPGVSAPHGGMQLYVGSLHFNLTESDIKQVFEPFGELEFVDLHKDPMTGRSKGYAFVQYKKAEDAKMALEQMDGFELAGRSLRVNTVHEKGTARYTQQDSLDDTGGGNLNAASRQALMQKLARIEPTAVTPQPVAKPAIASTMTSKSVLLKNMFDPEEESGNEWDRELAEDVKGECEEKYGKVERIKVEKETQGEIYVKFDSVESAKKAVDGLNGRWFGGKQVSATFIADAIMQAHQ